MAVQPRTFDFSKTRDIVQHASGKSQEDMAGKPIDADGKLLTAKQIRARARRKRKRNVHLSSQELEYLYKKPIEEWDLEELAHGRPRNIKGHFTGPTPDWIDRTVHEAAMEKYTAAVKSSMRATTVDALDLLKELIGNDDVDERGKPIVAWSTKLDAAKFLLEHVVGKPTQRIESDVSVKLQGILGQVMVNPADMATGHYMPAHFPGITMALSTGDEMEEAEYEEEDEV